MAAHLPAGFTELHLWRAEIHRKGRVRGSVRPVEGSAMIPPSENRKEMLMRASTTEAETVSDQRAGVSAGSGTVQAGEPLLRVLKIQTDSGNKSYVRVERQYNGFWVAVGDENHEQDVWLTSEQVRELGATLTRLALGPDGDDTSGLSIALLAGA